VVAVEAALIIPLFLLFVFGLIDIGYGIFQTSQATAAARDGGRVAILAYKQADVSGSADWTKINDAVRARLAGQTVESITVTCQQPSGSTVACSAAKPDADRIRVVIAWTYHPLTFVGAAVGDRPVTGTATMTIIGLPV